MAQVKRSVSIKGHRTSYSLEPEFHQALEAICEKRQMAMAKLIAEIDKSREAGTNLSSALRLFVLREILTERDDLLQQIDR